ncbi:hypothetical protein [Xanthobacter sp. KR7-225]|uniref:hypothetical protein n=1 Tax=Xanthobacter sp. KR7-225 TaxID=3156613 RepID=UPI0032B5B4FE
MKPYIVPKIVELSIPGSAPLANPLDETQARLEACALIGALPIHPETRLRTLFLLRQFHEDIMGELSGLREDGEVMQ